MESIRLPLDAGQHHHLRFDLMAPGSVRVGFESAPEYRHSELRSALALHLRVGEFMWAELAAGGNPILQGTQLDIKIGAAKLATLDLQAAVLTGPIQFLTPFETRYLADNRRPFARTLELQPAGCLKTDLHAHFAGCPRPDDLMRLGLQHGVIFPVAALRHAGVHAPREVALAEMSEAMRQRIARALAIPLDRQATYREMQSVYRARQPLTKQLSMFAPLCWQIARDYADSGVEYAELSLHQIVEREWLDIALRELPRIEAETGVCLRFLASFGRHDEPRWIRNYLGRVLDVAAHPAIVGIDVVGHETNSTHAFAPLLRQFAQVIPSRRAHFVVRVHAGENPGHPENISAAVACVRGSAVQLRIGHGVHGVDSATLEGLAAVGAIVEFNLSSNFALNNVQTFDAAEVPICRYLEHGVGVVLGSDGCGIYCTTLPLEATSALACGATPAQLDQIRATEARYRELRRVDAQRLVESNADGISGAEFEAGFALDPAMSPESMQQRRAAIQQRLHELEVQVVAGEQIYRLLRGKRVISIAGAWKRSWERLEQSDRQKIEAVLKALLMGCDPTSTALIVGGTCHGVEAAASRLARTLGYTVLGAVVLGHADDDYAAGLLTHAAILGNSIYDKCDALYRLVREHDGWCLFFGGGVAVGDEIQTARNLCLNRLLFAGIPGASGLHAQEQVAHAFTTAEEALKAMNTPRRVGRLYHPQANPAADIAVFRRSGESCGVLLIRRLNQVSAEPGRWSLPGGFVDTDAEPGTPWRAGRETPREAAVRELREETGLDLSARIEQVAYVGDFEGGGRDPRDTAESWVRSTAFAVVLDADVDEALVHGGDDAIEARWTDLRELPPLAFDHAEVLRQALLVTGLQVRMES